MNKTVYEFDCYGTIAKVTINYSQYMDPKNVAVILNDANDGSCWAKLSTNIRPLPDGQFAVDTNNCPTAEDFLSKYNIATSTGKSIQSGFCTYPIYALTETEYKKYLNFKREHNLK